MQEQKTGLNKREKRLLIAASVVGLFYLAFQFGFVPYHGQYTEKTEEYEDLRMERIRVEGVLLGEENVRKSNEKAKEDYKTLEAGYLLAGANTNLGRKLTGICTASGLSVESQTLNDPAPFFVPREDDTKPEGDAAFSIVTVTMTVSGGYDKVKNLLDAVDKDDAVRVSNLSFSLNRGDGGGEGLERVEVTFVVTLLNGLE